MCMDVGNMKTYSVTRRCEMCGALMLDDGGRRCDACRTIPPSAILAGGQGRTSGDTMSTGAVLGMVLVLGAVGGAVRAILVLFFGR